MIIYNFFNNNHIFLSYLLNKNPNFTQHTITAAISSAGKSNAAKDQRFVVVDTGFISIAAIEV
ncbi:hypothetical protein HanPSC8_Chr01g0022161 [Helianthus annuus]|nr:hypothetical protein HanPSC8_Chr01g0022161 [Helianthus annuus]